MRAPASIRAAVTAASVAVTGLLVAVAIPSSAMADEARDEAKALTQRASTEFKLAHFEVALDLYTQAYERVHAPELLFNLGQCQKNLGKNERALFFFRGYLREKPDAPNQAAVQALIAELEGQLANETKRKAAEDAEQRKLEELNAEKAAAEAQVAAAAAQRSVPPPPPPPPPELHRRPRFIVAGAIAGGAGLVALGTATYFGLHAASEASDLGRLSTTGGTWTAQDRATYSNGQTSATAASALFVIGGVLAAGGATLAIVGLQRHAEPSSTTVGFAATPWGSSVVVTGSF